MVRKLSLAVLLVAAMFVVVAYGQPAGNAPSPVTYTLKVVAPNGGEALEEGSSQVVSWKLDAPTAPDSIQISLVLPPDPNITTPGGNVKMLAMLTKEVKNEWTWDKVTPLGKGLKIEVKAFFPKRKPVKDQSDKGFSIVPASVMAKQPTPYQALTVATPNGGEKWLVGSSQVITWTMKDVTTPVGPGDAPMFVVVLARDGKTFDEKLATGVPWGTKTFTVKKVTGPASDKCRIKVMVMNLPGTPIEDISDADFIIMSDVAQPTGHSEGQK